MTRSRLDHVWPAIIAHLRDEISAVQRDIRDYPTPIPACDEQFNSLLDRREKLSRELAQARELSVDRNPEIARDFVRSSAYLHQIKGSVARIGGGN